MLDRDAILGAFERLAALLRERGAEGEVCLLGGTVMVLAFRSRPATKDVDAIFQPAALVRELARTVAAERDLPAEWLNDGAKGFISRWSSRVDMRGNANHLPGHVATTPMASTGRPAKTSRARSS